MTHRIIGMLGGMSWASSAEYYRLVNEGVRDRLGGVHSARCLMWSFDFDDIAVLQREDRWDESADLMIEAAQRLERGGADFLVICTNTMHKAFDRMQAAVSLPLLHIADPTAERIKAAGFTRVGLLGTAFTMEQEFYKGRLTGRHGLDVLVPDAPDRAAIHRIIYDELVKAHVVPSSRTVFQDAIGRLVAAGAQCIILGCTEIMLLIGPEDSPVPLYDTTALHAAAAVDRALA
jgi:aspartate racemase